MEEKKQALLVHLAELRKRLIISLLALFLGMIFSFIFAQEKILAIIKKPLEQIGEGLVFLTVTESFVLQIKVAFLGGLFFALPIILGQIIAFIVPALYQRERRIFWPIFFSSLLLFVLGIVFAYKVVFLLALRFFVVDLGGGFTPMLSASRYFSFFLAFLLPFGFVFEIPVLVYLLTKAGFLTPEKLRGQRRFVILLTFILAAFLTPPDVISQVLLALPMLVLYELSILIAHLVKRK